MTRLGIAGEAVVDRGRGMAVGEGSYESGRAGDRLLCGVNSRDVDDVGDGVVREREGVRVVGRARPEGLRRATLRNLSNGDAYGYLIRYS